MTDFRHYQPPGPVAAAFLDSAARVRAIMGPIGSGKTGACVMRPLYVAMRQAPHPRDGVRRSRFTFIRKTYRDLERTLIRSWLHWVPKDLGQWVGGSGGQPATHMLRFALADGTTVETEVMFLAIGENSAEEAMRGLELTGAYLNEADTLDEEVLIYANSRVGRFPARDATAGFGGCAWCGVWLDFNAPDTDHWIYRRFVEDLPEGWAFFRQPGAFEAGAENLANLSDGYYQGQMVGQPDWWIRRMIHNQWGYSRDGAPVYPEFNDTLHVAPEILKPLPGLKLVIGGDAGLTAAVLLGQRTSLGQVRWLDELVAPPGGWGAKACGEALNQLLAERYPGLECEGWCDPAGINRVPTDEKTWMLVMQAVTGFSWRPAATNKPLLRWEAVRAPLTRLIDGQPGFQLSPRCKITRKGFNSGYRFRRRRGPGGRYAEEAEKNDFSHPHDGGQYLNLGLGEHIAVLGRQQARGAARHQTHAVDDDGAHPAGGWAGRQAHAVE